ARLSVLRGGWTLESARAVCADPHALEHLEQLLQHSMILAEERLEQKRFRMLETLREFAAEQLDEADREETACRHTAFFLELAETAAPHLSGPDRQCWQEQLDSEHENLLTALSRCLKSPGFAGLRLAGALWRYWHLRSYITEGRRWLENALCQPASDSQARARALHGYGAL